MGPWNEPRVDATAQRKACCSCLLTTWLLVAAVWPAQSFGAEDSYGLTCPPCYVEGYPMLAVVTVEAGRDGRHVLYHDLATFYGECVELTAQFTNQEGTVLQIGNDGKDAYEDYWRAPGYYDTPEVELKRGEKLIMVLDLAQLAKYRGMDTLPGRGTWNVTVGPLPDRASASNVQTVRIREPTYAERQVAARLSGRSPYNKSWFPDIVHTPVTLGLPPESGVPVELVRVLRAATVSAEAGLDALDEAQVDWDYLAPAIVSIRYECLLRSGQAERAKEFRKEHEDYYGALHFDLVDDGQGLIQRLRGEQPVQSPWWYEYEGDPMGGPLFPDK